MKKMILALSLLLSTQLWAQGNLVLQVEDLLDLATYDPVAELVVSLDEVGDVEHHEEFIIDSWWDNFKYREQLKGHHIKVDLYVKKVFENNYAVKVVKNLYFQDRHLKTLLDKRVVVSEKPDRFIDVYWGGEDLVVRQRNSLFVR